MASHNKRPVHKAVLSLLQRLPRIRITDSNIAGQNVTIGGCQLVLNISVYVGIAILLSVVVLVIASHWSTPPQNTLSAPVPVQNVVSEQASIQAITADKMRFWLATDMGLYRYELSNGRTEFFEGNYTAVAVSPDGKKMWFSQANGTVGWYENAVTVPTRLTPPVDHNRVLSIQPDTNGDVFFGDMVSGVFRYTASGAWQPLSGLEPNSRVEHMALTSSGVLWVIATDTLLRWENTWEAFPPSQTMGFVGSSPATLASDKHGALWLGNETGLSILVDGTASANMMDDHWIRCTADASGKALGFVTGIAFSSKGVWLVSDVGVSFAELPPEALKKDSQCSQWFWKTWRATDADKDFWESSGEGRMVALIETAPEQSLLWIVKKGASKIRVVK